MAYRSDAFVRETTLDRVDGPCKRWRSKPNALSSEHKRLLFGNVASIKRSAMFETKGAVKACKPS